jgi:hypothetical protein
MSNDPATISNDGWVEAASDNDEQTMRGDLLRFTDWRWTAGKERRQLPRGTKLVAVSTAAAWVRWFGNKPIETVWRKPGRKLPDREDLSFTDEAQWDIGPDGEPRDPWQNTRYVYLIDPKTAEAFTFSTSSWGGRRAVADLGDQITRTRAVHADAVPLVELDAAEMPTKHGLKSKPVFKIVAWRTADQNKEVPAEREVSADKAAAAIGRREMDDEIPF